MWLECFVIITFVADNLLLGSFTSRLEMNSLPAPDTAANSGTSKS